MLHSKLFNPLNPILGMAPLEATMLRVDAQNEGATLMKRLLERGYTPGGSRRRRIRSGKTRRSRSSRRA